MREEEGPADSASVFGSEARVGGNQSLTREVSFPLGLLEKGDEVAKLVDSSMMGKRIERPLLSRGNTGSSLAKDLGVLMLAHTSNRPPPHSQEAVFSRVGVPTPQTDRHHMVRERRG